MYWHCRTFNLTQINMAVWLWFVAILLVHFDEVHPQKRKYDITELSVGAIIEQDAQGHEISLRKGIQAANKLLLENGKGPIRIQLVLDIEKVPSGDSFTASRRACKLLERRVIAIFGPSTPLASNNVQSLCNQFGIPHLELQWGYRKTPQSYAINFHPDYKTYAQVLMDYISKMDDWKSVAFIYSSEDSLLKFDQLLNTLDKKLIIRRWTPQDGNHKYLIKSLYKSNMTRFIVDIPYWEIKEFLIMASNYNMTTQYHSYIFADWDAQMVDLTSFNVYKGANITIFSVLPLIKDNDTSIFGNDPILDELLEAIVLEEKTKRSADIRRVITTNSALIYDGMRLLAMGILSLSRTSRIHPSSDLSCTGNQAWALGLSLTNSVKSVDTFSGLTGTFKFNSQGWRSNDNLTILEGTRDGYQLYGYWDQAHGLVVTKSYAQTMIEIQSELSNMTVRVTVKEDAPFVFYTGNEVNGVKDTDPKSWNGFCIQLLAAIAKDLNFTYIIKPVADKQYGNCKIITEEKVEDCNGMIGELIYKKADLAVASLTITYERERAIDFTTPFMNLGLSILYKKPKGKQPHLFSFLQPISPSVWGYVLAAYIMVSFVLFVVARFSPYEWFNPSPSNTDASTVSNQFNMFNSFWFTAGSLMQQGTDLNPRATSTRIVAGIWRFFTLIIISSYTANLAAFLTVARMKAPIENADDLSKQTKIKYGTLSGGSTQDFFKKSDIPVFKKMGKYMDSNPGVFVNSTEQGINRVRTQNYAFILESLMNEYYVQRDCDLMRVGDLLDSKGYGIGLPQGSKYRDAISESILKLQKSQTLETMQRYWWRQYNISVPCIADDKKEDTSSLGVEQVGGVFVMLLIGMVMSFLVAVLELMYKSNKRSKVLKRSFCEEFGRELRIALNCSSNKPASGRAKREPQLPPSNHADDTFAAAAANSELIPMAPGGGGVPGPGGPRGSREGSWRRSGGKSQALPQRNGTSVERCLTSSPIYQYPPPPASPLGQMIPPYVAGYQDDRYSDRQSELLRLKRVPC